VTEQHLIALAVAAELADQFEQHAHLLTPARIDHREADGQRQYLYWMDAPQAPAGAHGMTPTFARAADGETSLQTIEWYDADGNPL
jgi:hypothetical protein